MPDYLALYDEYLATHRAHGHRHALWLVGGLISEPAERRRARAQINAAVARRQQDNGEQRACDADVLACFRDALLDARRRAEPWTEASRQARRVALASLGPRQSREWTDILDSTADAWQAAYEGRDEHTYALDA